MSDRNIAGEIGQAGLDHAAHAYADIGSTGQQVLFGRNMPATPTPGETVTTTTTGEPLTGEPESMRSALMKHAAAEGAQHYADRFRQQAGQESAPDIQPAMTGFERYSATFHAAPDTGGGSHYGVGAQETQQPQQEPGYGPEL